MNVIKPRSKNCIVIRRANTDLFPAYGLNNKRVSYAKKDRKNIVRVST